MQSFFRKKRCCMISHAEGQDPIGMPVPCLFHGSLIHCSAHGSTSRVLVEVLADQQLEKCSTSGRLLLQRCEHCGAALHEPVPLSMHGLRLLRAYLSTHMLAGCRTTKTELVHEAVVSARLSSDGREMLRKSVRHVAWVVVLNGHMPGAATRTGVSCIINLQSQLKYHCTSLTYRLAECSLRVIGWAT